MSPHRIVGKWYYGLGSGQYIRYEFTVGGAYRYSNPARMMTGTYVVQEDQLTLTPEGEAAESYAFRFECIGTGSFSEYLTLTSTSTGLESPFTRDPTDPGRRCP